MTYLPAPYESPQQDDLSATLCAILTTTVGLITSWVIGQQAYPVLKDYIDAAMGNLSSDQEDALKASLDTALVPAVGWARRRRADGDRVVAAAVPPRSRACWSSVR